MYIIHETVAGNDPRIHPSMTVVGSYWLYTMRYIPDNLSETYVEWLKGTKVSENVAKAYKFCGAKDNEITVRKATTVYEEIACASAESVLGAGAKSYYYLTGEDVLNTTILLKTIMLNYTGNHLKNQEVKPQLLSMIEACNTIEDCHWMLATYFDCETATTYNKEKKPIINVEWL